MYSTLRPIALVSILFLAGCSSVALMGDAAKQRGTTADSAEDTPEPAAATSIAWIAGETNHWQHKGFPGKRASLYSLGNTDGRDAMAVHASASCSMLRQAVHVTPADLNLLRFSWKVPALIDAADLRSRELDDSPVRIVLAFEGDRSKFSIKNALLSELSHALTGEPMPYATLMYVWSNHIEQGAVVHNPRTDRIRKIVMESGPKSLGQWNAYERDIRADFEKAFGEAPGALVAIGIMTDSDNTQSVTNAWYGPVQLVARQP